jgi:hypothetical protein
MQNDTTRTHKCKLPPTTWGRPGLNTSFPPQKACEGHLASSPHPDLADSGRDCTNSVVRGSHSNTSTSFQITSPFAMGALANRPRPPPFTDDAKQMLGCSDAATTSLITDTPAWPSSSVTVEDCPRPRVVSGQVGPWEGGGGRGGGGEGRGGVEGYESITAVCRLTPRMASCKHLRARHGQRGCEGYIHRRQARAVPFLLGCLGTLTLRCSGVLWVRPRTTMPAGPAAAASHCIPWCASTLAFFKQRNTQARQASYAFTPRIHWVSSLNSPATPSAHRPTWEMTFRSLGVGHTDGTSEHFWIGSPVAADQSLLWEGTAGRSLS